LEIAKLMVDGNYTVKQACEASGAGETAVKRWRQQYLAERAGKPLPNARALTPEQREIQQLKQHIKELETEKEILIPTRGTRKSQRLLCQGNGMSYGLVDELKEAHPASQLCAVLDVQKSSYYYWQGHRQPTAQHLRLQVHAKAVHTENRQIYGSSRMSAALKAKGLAVGRHQARSLMQAWWRCAPRSAIAIRQARCYASPTTTWTANLTPISPTKNGGVTTRIYGRRLDGYIWRWC
jgi:transposase